MLTLATCACAVAVANGQVSVPGVQTPPVNTPPLQDLPQVPSTPSVPVPSVPNTPSVKVPSAPNAPSLPKVPSVKLPKSGAAPKLPSVQAPGAGGLAGDSTGAGAVPGSGTATGAAGGSGASQAATAAAASRRARNHRPLSPRQRSARHERRLRTAARELEGCLPALSSFERDVIVLRGGLHGRDPLSRSKTAARLDVGAGRVRSAERSGLAGLRRADAEQGCGLRSGAGRDAAARRLADGSVPGLSPLAVAGSSPELVSTDDLAPDRGKVLGAQAESGPKPEPSRAGVIPTSGDDGSPLSAGLWAALLAALLIAAAGGVVLWRRRAADPYGYGQGPSVYPYGWSSTSEPTPTPAAPSQAPEPAPAPPAPATTPEPRADSSPPRPGYSFFGLAATEARGDEDTATPPGPPAHPEPHDLAGQGAEPSTPRRRDRAMQAAGGLAASGAALSLLLGRLTGRRRR